MANNQPYLFVGGCLDGKTFVTSGALTINTVDIHSFGPLTEVTYYLEGIRDASGTIHYFYVEEGMNLTAAIEELLAHYKKA
jgi:hypothetical protein